MHLQEIEKSKFAQNNYKIYYLSDGTVSLPFSHPSLSEIAQFKNDKKQRVEAYILEVKQKLLAMEKDAVLKNKRLSLLRNILLQNPTFYQIDS